MMMNNKNQRLLRKSLDKFVKQIVGELESESSWDDWSYAVWEIGNSNKIYLPAHKGIKKAIYNTIDSKLKTDRLASDIANEIVYFIIQAITSGTADKRNYKNFRETVYKLTSKWDPDFDIGPVVGIISAALWDYVDLRHL